MISLKETLTAQKFYMDISKSEKPVIVNFYTNWSEPCKCYSPILMKVAQKYKEKAEFINLNADENIILTSKYGIRTIPSVMVFLKGKPKFISVGIKSENSLEQELKRFL